MKFFKVLLSKPTIIVLSIFLQVGIFLGLFYMASVYFKWFQVVTYALGVIIFLVLVNKETKPDHKLPWLTLITFLPIIGLVLYLLFGNIRISKKHRKILSKLTSQHFILLDDRQEDKVKQAMGEDYGQSLSLENQSGYPAHTNTDVKYFETGEKFFQNLLVDLRTAKKFIFMEYFIIEDGYMWSSILAILKEKVKQGVDVRVIYDDVGCMWKLKNNYYKYHKFNKFNPTVSNIHNYRDHRKITVIDGVIAYTGGANLADEYINKVQKFGYWKDCAVRIYGKAVKNFTLMFLHSYYLTSNIPQEDFSKFACDYNEGEENGVVQPFASDPLYCVGEESILNIINQSKEYLYIATPYLICDYTLLNAIKQASLRGVDVRIVVPNVPDKKLVWTLTRSCFEGLIKAGVKIFQYKPGFVHSKLILSDDKIGMVGTINLDYRSLVHHFEDGVLLYKTSCLKDIYNDFKEMFLVSTYQTEEMAKMGFWTKLTCAVFRIFTPMM